MGIYAYRNAFLQRFPTLSPGVLERLESLEQLRALEHGETIRVHRWPKTPAPGIDTAQDLALVRQLLADPHSRSEEHTSELQSRGHLVCRLLLEKKKSQSIEVN